MDRMTLSSNILKVNGWSYSPTKANKSTTNYPTRNTEGKDTQGNRYRRSGLEEGKEIKFHRRAISSRLTWTFEYNKEREDI